MSKAIDRIEEIIKNYEDDIKTGTPRSNQEFIIGRRTGRHEASDLAKEALAELEQQPEPKDSVEELLGKAIRVRDKEMVFNNTYTIQDGLRKVMKCVRESFALLNQPESKAQAGESTELSNNLKLLLRKYTLDQTSQELIQKICTELDRQAVELKGLEKRAQKADECIMAFEKATGGLPSAKQLQAELKIEKNRQIKAECLQCGYIFNVMKLHPIKKESKNDM